VGKKTKKLHCGYKGDSGNKPVLGPGGNLKKPANTQNLEDKNTELPEEKSLKHDNKKSVPEKNENVSKCELHERNGRESEKEGA